MSKLEELLTTKITTDNDIKTKLAKYKTVPAFFELTAPADNDSGWAGEQYPRIDYRVDRSEDPARRIQGTAEANIWCTVDGSVTPEVLETRIRALLDGAVFRPDNEPVTAFKWARSDPFEASIENIDIIGYTVLFDLLAFPAQSTSVPDPVAALNTWAAAKFPTLQVDPTTWAPTDETPALYWRLAGLQMVERTAAVAWVNATLVAHILAPTPQGRLPWIKKITEQLAKDMRVSMSDGAPMLVISISADGQADHFRTGQVRAQVRYGVLVPRPDGETMNAAHVTGAEDFTVGESQAEEEE